MTGPPGGSSPCSPGDRDVVECSDSVRVYRLAHGVIVASGHTTKPWQQETPDDSGANHRARSCSVRTAMHHRLGYIGMCACGNPRCFLEW